MVKGRDERDAAFDEGATGHGYGEEEEGAAAEEEG